MQMRFYGPMVLSPEIFYIFTYILIPALLLYRTRILPRNTYNGDFLSKSNTGVLRGVCVILILVHHFSQQLFDASYLRPFKYIGVFAVALFFFLSAYGMTVSLSKNPDYLKRFLLKRFKSIYIPYLIINTVTVIIMSLYYRASYTVTEIVLFTLGIKLIDASLWFVHRILIYYVVFYLTFKFLSKNKALIAISLFTAAYCVVCYRLGRGIWEFRTAFSFPLGVLFGLYHGRIFRILSEHYVKVTALCAVCFIAAGYVYYHMDVFPLVSGALAALFLILLVVLMLMKVTISSKPFSFLGSISYEIYLIHMKVLIIAYSLAEITHSCFLYIYLCMVILTAFLFNKALKLNLQRKPEVTAPRFSITPKA